MYPVTQPPQTRIQKRNRATIMEAALNVFSQYGFRGATLDQIAKEAGLSKPNLLYYFRSKEAVHGALLSQLLENWQEPLEALDPDGEPIEELIAYVLRKLEIARAMPRESRLFANEIVQGAPRIIDQIEGPLRALIDHKAALITIWMQEHRLAALDPHHLIFSISATTQHYADFDAQVRGILAPEGDEHFDTAAIFLEKMYRAALAPEQS